MRKNIFRGALLAGAVGALGLGYGLAQSSSIPLNGSIGAITPGDCAAYSADPHFLKDGGACGGGGGGGTVALAQIAQGGATAGQALEWNGTAWAPGAVSSGLNAISNTLTSGSPGSPGVINPADILTIITGGTAFSLAAAADTHTHKINNQSTVQVAVTLTLNGASQTIDLAAGDFIAVSYQSSLSTYIVI